MSYHGLMQTPRNVVLKEKSVLTPQGLAPSPIAHLVHGTLKGWVMSEGFPCYGASTAFNRHSYRLGIYERFSNEDVSALASDLGQYIAEYGKAPAVKPKPTPGDWVGLDRTFASFLACFTEEPVCDEIVFEKRLWTVLRNLRTLDHHSAPSGYSLSPSDNNFAFCFQGEAFFVASFHPGSWRWSRRFMFPLLVFNMHRQFDGLKSVGKWESLRDKIRENDNELQGLDNKLVADFGQRSEAPQYAMRHVPDDWTPPGYSGE